jgi:hypothetical protein
MAVHVRFQSYFQPSGSDYCAYQQRYAKQIKLLASFMRKPDDSAHVWIHWPVFAVAR